MRIDAHQHFWNYSDHPRDYVWMTDEYASLRRNFGPSDLKPILDENGFSGSVVVQARELSSETAHLLKLAAEHSFILGVVGWLDLCNSKVEAQIASFANDRKLRGLRMLIHDRPDPDFAMSSEHVEGVSLLERYGLTYDLLLKPPHILSATRLVARLPNQLFVVDHIAKPDIASGLFEPWGRELAILAKHDNVYCKLSSLVTQAVWERWSPAEITPYLDHVLEVFGAERLMIGSDWPVSTVAADYRTTVNVVLEWTGRLSASEQAAILGGTCRRFYGLEVP
ncbi:MAG: amidohydrolase family protein [Rhizobium sp.]|nr:amidohydrolase family protein [Rhizobium sp.]